MMTTTETIALLGPILATVVNVLVMATVPRIAPALSFYRAIFLAFGAGMTALLLVETARYSMAPADSIEFFMLAGCNVAIFGFIGFVFFNALNVGESSIRVRILRELLAAEGPMSEADLLDRYNDQLILGSRLERLLEGGQIEKRDGRYFLKATNLLVVARIIRWAKIVLLHRTSEFD